MMTRPRKNVVDYFPHMAHYGMTLKIIDGKFGNDGYAFWFKVLEQLASTEDHFLDLKNQERWEYLQAITKLNAVKTMEIIDLLAKLQAIDQELWECDRIIWSQNLVENVRDVYANRRRELPTKPISTGKPIITTSCNPMNVGITTLGNPQSKVKYSIVKESKVKNTLSGKKQPDDSFENLWKMYNIAHKGSKKKAEDEFKKLKPQNGSGAILISLMMNAITLQLTNKTDCDAAKIFCPELPHFERWIKHRRWEDEIKTAESIAQDERKAQEEAYARENTRN